MRSFDSTSVVLLAFGSWPAAQKKCFGFVRGDVPDVAAPAPTIPTRVTNAAARATARNPHRKVFIDEWPSRPLTNIGVIYPTGSRAQTHPDRLTSQSKRSFRITGLEDRVRRE